MTVSLRIADMGDMDRVDRMVASYHALVGVEADEATRRAALTPLLEGTPLGVIYLVGPPSSPVGYLAISFGYSIAGGGIEARLDQFHIREAVRRRGMGTETLSALIGALSGYGVRAVHVDLEEKDEGIRRICTRLRFKPSEAARMTRTL